MLLNGQEDYELVPYTPVERQDDVAVFTFRWDGRSWAVVWHKTGGGRLTLSLTDPTLTYRRQPDGEDIPFDRTAQEVTLPVDGKAYLSTAMDETALRAVFGS